VGMAAVLYMLYDTPNPNTGKTHFGGAQYALSNFGIDTKTTLYTGLLALALNFIVAIVVTLILRAMHVRELEDYTSPDDYDVEAGEPGVEPLPAAPAEQEAEVPAGRH
jgi:solute:Na+ symporter, SSS family